MTPVHVHLMLNHFPVIGSIIGLGIMAAGVLLKNDTLKQTSLILFILAALCTAPVFLSGHGAEEIAEVLPGVNETIVAAHEEAADLTTVAMTLLGLAALIIIILYRTQPIPAWVCLFILTLAFVTGGLMSYTANLGGQVRHTEIRHDPVTTLPIEREKEHDDD